MAKALNGVELDHRTADCREHPQSAFTGQPPTVQRSERGVHDRRNARRSFVTTNRILFYTTIFVKVVSKPFVMATER